MADVNMQQNESDTSLFPDNSKILVDIPVVTDCVLKHLPMKALNRSARVCRLWNEVAKKLKRRRQQCVWLLFTFPASSDFSQVSSVTEQISERLCVMSSEPETAIMFLSTSAYEQSVPLPTTNGSSSHPRACKQEKVQFPTFLGKALPETCSLVGVTTDGIIGTFSDNCHPVEFEKADAGSVLLLPKINGLGVHTFMLTEDVFSLPNPTKEDLGRIIGLPDLHSIKVLFLFFAIDSSLAFSSNETSLIEGFVREYGDIVVAGGYVNNLILMNGAESSLPQEAVVVGIAWYGEQVKMASTIIEPTVRSIKKVEECMKRLKDTNIPVDPLQNHVFGFQFACVGRGNHQYRKNNVEADAFKKHFPDIPLLGFFGNGEIGSNYLPDYKNSNKRDVEPDLDMHHSYTTIMTLISVPKHLS